MQSLVPLWRLDSEYVSILEQIEMNEGILTQELELQLDNTLADLVRKQDSYLMIMDNLDTVEQQAKQWRDKMAAKIRTIQNQKERLKNALIDHLHQIGQNELQGELGKVRLMKSVKVGEVNEDKLPAIYKIIVQETRIDKKRLLADLKTRPVKGAALEKTEYLKIF